MKILYLNGNKTMKKLIAVIMVFFTPHTVFADEGSQHKSEYAGEEARQIKSLSAEDIEELSSGAGWGFAKAAELNGVPGPKHLLEMADDVPLTPEQRDAIGKVYDAMLAEAVPLGEQFIAAERKLDTMFKDGPVDKASLQQQLEHIGALRTKLRYVHLSKHLEMADIVSKEQVKKYNKLRGYDSDDICDNIPEGHNAELFKKHNGCE